MKKEGILWKAATFILLVALAVSLYTSQVQAGQPHMQSALTSLQTALSQLQKADTDKGGHRAKAIDLVKSAIVEVQLGIKAGAGK